MVLEAGCLFNQLAYVSQGELRMSLIS